MNSGSWCARRLGRALGVFVVSGAAGLGAATPSGAAPSPVAPTLDTLLAARDSGASRALDSLFGHSGKLRVKLVADPRDLGLTRIARFFGLDDSPKPGIYQAKDSAVTRPFSLIALLPFTAKSAGKVGTYRVGSWRSETRAPRSAAYSNHAGFIQVTRENQDTPVSEHFRLRDFLTKDQQNVWPKYLVLREPLIDKLELIIDDLAKRGISVKRMTVMSGFRTPQYNVKGVGSGGRASDSRHQYGDAADVFVDNDGNGRMDDLNRDGRIDHRDAQVILDAAERIERAYPTLVGGGGLYRATRAHGPFAHIDVRGARARWGS